MSSDNITRLIHQFWRTSLLLFCVINVQAQTQVGIVDPGIEPPPMIALSPSRLELTLEGNRADDAFKVINMSEQAVDIQTEVNHWTLDKHNRVRAIAPSETSLDQWLIASPLKFTIPAKSSQIVRISARPPFEPENKEYRAMLSFVQQLPSVQDQVGLKVRFKLNAVVYISSGEIERYGQIDSITLRQNDGNQSVDFNISSEGNGGVRLDGQISVWPKSQYPGSKSIPDYILDGQFENIPDAAQSVRLLPKTPILAGTQRTLKAPVLAVQTTTTEPRVVHVRGRLGKDGPAFERHFIID